MKTEGTIHGARLKAEVLKDDDGNPMGADTFWLVTLKLPAGRINANELNDMYDELLTVHIESKQARLPLGTTKPEAAA